MDFSKDNDELDTVKNENLIYSNKQNNNNIEIRKNNFFSTKKIKKDENDSAEKIENTEINDYKRDDSKWKFSKNELLERKKRLLKDKSNIKKVKK